jgi:hypothetical protein
MLLDYSARGKLWPTILTHTLPQPLPHTHDHSLSHKERDKARNRREGTTQVALGVHYFFACCGSGRRNWDVQLKRSLVRL